MKNKSKILPVLFGFFIMGFCDLVGVSVTYAKDYFSWSETQAGFLPSMVFIWFLLISIPISIWMDKKGRKTISLIGLLSTFINPEKPDVPLNKNDAFQKVQKRRVQEKR